MEIYVTIIMANMKLQYLNGKTNIAPMKQAINELLIFCLFNQPDA